MLCSPPFPLSPSPSLIFPLCLFFALSSSFLTSPYPPAQMAVWENSVLHICFLWHVVWHLQSDHSNPAEHGVLCESMLSALW